MRFTVDGQQFDLDRADVLAALRGHAAEDPLEYWIAVDGARWPVKQAFALATGLDRTRFQSQTARRQLQRLGFTVHGEGRGPNAVCAPRGRAVDVTELTPLDEVRVAVTFRWYAAGEITLDTSGAPLFPRLPSLPGLYRFTFTGADGDRTYVGESADLAKRARQYRNAKRDRTRARTSRRLHKEFVAHLALGGTVSFAIATEVRIDGRERELDLRLKSARRLAENAAVLTLQLRGDVVLNIDTDIGEHCGDDE